MRRDFVLSKFFIRSAKSHDTFLGIIWRMVQRRIHCICSIVSKIWLPVTRRILAIRRCLKSHAWKKKTIYKIRKILLKKPPSNLLHTQVVKMRTQRIFFSEISRKKNILKITCTYFSMLTILDRRDDLFIRASSRRELSVTIHLLRFRDKLRSH